MTAPDKEGVLNMEDKNKACPLKFSGQNNFAQTPWCEKEDCAWWCDWQGGCALVANAAELSDRLSEIREAVCSK